MERRAEVIQPLLVLGAEDSPTEEEIEAYRQAHPPHIVILYRRDCGEGSLD